jgi:hypothetical protein
MARRALGDPAATQQIRLFYESIKICNLKKIHCAAQESACAYQKRNAFYFAGLGDCQVWMERVSGFLHSIGPGWHRMGFLGPETVMVIASKKFGRLKWGVMTNVNAQ